MQGEGKGETAWISLSHRRLEKQRTDIQYGVAEFADMNR